MQWREGAGAKSVECKESGMATLCGPTCATAGRQWQSRGQCQSRLTNISHTHRATGGSGAWHFGKQLEGNKVARSSDGYRKRKYVWRQQRQCQQWQWQLSAEQVQHRISNLNFYCADRETACLPAAVAAAAAAGGVVGQVQASAAAAAAINLLMKTGNKLGQLGQKAGGKPTKIQRQARKNAQKN